MYDIYMHCFLSFFQEPARVFTNNVIIRFHPGLEMEGDEVITVVCRYPPPIVPAPPIPLIKYLSINLNEY